MIANDFLKFTLQIFTLLAKITWAVCFNYCIRQKDVCEAVIYKDHCLMYGWKKGIFKRVILVHGRVNQTIDIISDVIYPIIIPFTGIVQFLTYQIT